MKLRNKLFIAGIACITIICAMMLVKCVSDTRSDIHKNEAVASVPSYTSPEANYSIDHVANPNGEIALPLQEINEIIDQHPNELSAEDVLQADANGPLPQGESGNTSPTAHPVTVPLDDPVVIEKHEGLTVYFIDVGQADSTLFVCDGATMLIDGGNVADSSLIYTFLKNHGITHLDYVVATHAHEDHVGGLSGALNYATVGTALSPVTAYDSNAFRDFVKYLGNQGVSITVPKAGDTFSLGGARAQIVGPINPSNEPNNTSIVMKVTYGATSFLFTGDAERDEEQDILNAAYNISATVLKVGHHGSDTSTTYPWLRSIMPKYAVISCGAGNSYGHPHDGPLSKLRDAGVTLYRTDMQGTITCISNGLTLTFTTERNASGQTNPTAHPAIETPIPAQAPVAAPSPTPAQTPSTASERYIGNLNTQKFHKPSCHTLPAEKNRIFFETRDAAIKAGYTPCGNCNP